LIGVQKKTDAKSIHLSWRGDGRTMQVSFNLSALLSFGFVIAVVLGMI